MPPMAFNTLWFWVFFLVAVAIPSLLAVEQEDAGSAQSTPRNAVWSWPIVFMHSKVIYLNLSTMEYPGIKCIKEYRETWNRSARLLTKVMVTVFTSEEWTSNKMVYNAAAKRRPAQAFTAVNESGSTSYRVAFNYTSEYCAIIKKQNETGGDYYDACELWVNDKYLKSEPQEQELCKTNFETYCNRNNATEFNYEDCQASDGKLTLIL
ncbi:uncharacterized protein LOC142769292 isoform X1 [Rhipicephalus microplus]|uniref:uncharacterized protein LOC142769292 isoform X1 n=1 Tax=Rhipicephalus microplus TaxID=6941 RepID=UPI001889B2D7|nr:uncharacterized protein LOC119184563 isoform X1 [Rhipicephalus microplus]